MEEKYKISGAAFSAINKNGEMISVCDMTIKRIAEGVFCDIETGNEFELDEKFVACFLEGEDENGVRNSKADNWDGNVYT